MRLDKSTRTNQPAWNINCTLQVAGGKWSVLSLLHSLALRRSPTLKHSVESVDHFLCDAWLAGVAEEAIPDKVGIEVHLSKQAGNIKDLSILIWLWVKT